MVGLKRAPVYRDKAKRPRDMAAAMDIDNLWDDLWDLVGEHEELADLTENSEHAD